MNKIGLKIISILLTASLAFGLGACNSSMAVDDKIVIGGEVKEIDNTDVVEIDIPDDTISGDFKINKVVVEDGVYTISSAGEYNLSGSFNGQIYIEIDEEAEERDVDLVLNGVSISYTENSPIYIKSADNVKIKAQNGTYNYINDNRSTYTEDVDGQGKGAIYAEDGDLNFVGKGSLKIVAGYCNGVHGKDDVSIKNLTMQVSAVHHGIKGNDSISISSGNIEIDCGGDGLKTENTSLSSKGKQRGSISITGGSLVINSVCDGVSAAYNVEVSEGTDDNGNLTVPAIQIKTNKYSSYSGTTISADSQSLYLRTTSYSSAYRYSAYINSSWYDAGYIGTQSISNGMGPGARTTTYYVYKISRPKSATSFVLYRFNALSSNSTTTYSAISDSKSFNSNADTVLISANGSRITFGRWTTYSTSENTNKASESAKGIKADNKVLISGGSIAISAYDDGIHANQGNDDLTNGLFDSGATPCGDIEVSGGTITISASDDGMHADRYLIVSNGTIGILTAYEGMEGNQITISGGKTTVVASDDGVNSNTKVGLVSSILVSGGVLDITVSPNGDTDGIDSNGTFTQTGGVVVSRGPNSQMASALDSEGAVTLSGGTLIVLGAIEQTPRTTGSVKRVTGISVHSKGSHSVQIEGEKLIIYNAYSYSQTIIYSDATVSV